MADQTVNSGDQHTVPPVRNHPQPEMSAPQSLNDAIRQELWYVDTIVATPFRMARRALQPTQGKWTQSLDEAIWAAEGMARLPVKFIQSAFGESMGHGQKTSH